LQDVLEEEDGLSNALTLDNRYTHAIHLPGTGSGLRISNITVARHDAAFLASAWASAGRGGLETEFEGAVFKKVGQQFSWVHRNAWIIRDLDGSLSGYKDSYIVPHGEQFARNDDCHEMPGEGSNICAGDHCTRNVYVPAKEGLCMNGTSASGNGCQDDLSNGFDTCDEALQMDPWNSTVCEEWIDDVETAWAPDEDPGCYDACTGELVQARTQFDCEFTYIANGNIWKNETEGCCMYNGSDPFFVLHDNHTNSSFPVVHDMEELCEDQMSAYRFGGFIVNYVDEAPGEPITVYQHGDIRVNGNKTGLDVDGTYSWQDFCVTPPCTDLELCTPAEVETRNKIRDLEANSTDAQCKEVGGFYNTIGVCIGPFGFEAGVEATLANCTAPECSVDGCTEDEAIVIDQVKRLSLQEDCTAPGCVECLECTYEEFERIDAVNTWRRNLFELPAAATEETCVAAGGEFTAGSEPNATACTDAGGIFNEARDAIRAQSKEECFDDFAGSMWIPFKPAQCVSLCKQEEPKFNPLSNYSCLYWAEGNTWWLNASDATCTNTTGPEDVLIDRLDAIGATYYTNQTTCETDLIPTGNLWVPFTPGSCRYMNNTPAVRLRSHCASRHCVFCHCVCWRCVFSDCICCCRYGNRRKPMNVKSMRRRGSREKMGAYF
jgi:hypothetical protein